MTEAVYVARESFDGEVDGVTVPVVAGQTRVTAGSPLLKQRPDAFAREGTRGVEQATAAPGERRGPENTREERGDDA